MAALFHCRVLASVRDHHSSDQVGDGLAMWQRYNLNDVRTIAHYLGVILLIGAVAMLAPLVIAVAFAEWNAAARYLFGVGVSFTVGGALRMLRVVPGNMTRQQAMAVTGFAWIVLSIVGALPLFLSPHYATYVDALFDTVSAFTTTDVTIISDLDHLSHADNTWRFVMNFAGGLGLVVVALSLGLMGRVTDSSLYSSEGRSEHVLPNVVQTTRFIFRLAVTFIAISGVILGVVLLVHGMEPVRAFLHGFWLSMAGFMTAGATPMSTSVAYYHSFTVEVVLMVIMICGGVNFALQSEICSGRHLSFLRDTEVRGGFIWWLVMLIAFIASICSAEYGAMYVDRLPILMRTGLFQFVSAATTTGFTTLGSSQMNAMLPSGSLLVLTLVMSVGGCAGSTSGGIKLQRLAIVSKAAYETLKNTASADSVSIVTSYYHIGRRRLNSPEVREAMTVFIMFVTTYIIGGLAGVACGFDALPAISESVAMASNCGISAGIASASIPLFLKVTYICEMWMGRLEFVALIALSVKIFVSLRHIPRKKG